MGFLGVALFFLISGFVVARAGSVEDARTFLLRRVLRIYPPLIVAVLLAVLAEYIRVRSGIGSALWSSISIASVLKAMTLANYVSVPQVVIVGVAWTLVIEMSYYILVWMTAPIFRSRVPDLAATALIILVVFIAISLDRTLGAKFFLLSVSVSYVPLLAIGQVVFVVTQRHASKIWALVVAFAAWVVFVWGLERTQPNFLTPSGSYGSSLSIAALLFVGAVLAEGKVRPNRVLYAVAARSYSLYLAHGSVGLLLLDLLWDHRAPYRWALVVAVVGTAVATELIYRGAERPSIALGRRLTRRWRRVRATPIDPGKAVDPSGGAASEVVLTLEA